MIHTHTQIIMAINTDATNMRGWFGGAMVLGSFKCRGVLLHLHIVGQEPGVVAAGAAGWVGVLFFFFFISSILSSFSNASSLWRWLLWSRPLLLNGSCQLLLEACSLSTG